MVNCQLQFLILLQQSIQSECHIVPISLLKRKTNLELQGIDRPINNSAYVLDKLFSCSGIKVGVVQPKLVLLNEVILAVSI